MVFATVAFGAASDYASVPAGDYTLQVRPYTSANDGNVVATFDVSPAGGNVYTGFAVGYIKPKKAPANKPFDLKVTANQTS